MDTPPPEEDLATFPAKNRRDIAHQIANDVSGEHLLQSYLRSTESSRSNMSWATHDDGEIKFHGRIWQVSRRV